MIFRLSAPVLLCAAAFRGYMHPADICILRIHTEAAQEWRHLHEVDQKA